MFRLFAISIFWIALHAPALGQTAEANTLDRACASGDMSGCVSLGEMWANGVGVPQDYARARTLYYTACTAAFTPGCLKLASLYSNGHGVPQDHARAAGFYEQACNYLDPRGCLRLGTMYRMGVGVPQDSAKAAILFRAACEGGLGFDCPSPTPPP